MEPNGSGARFFAVVAKIGNALTQLMNALLITAANGNSKGKFQLFNLVSAVNKTATITERRVRTGLRVNGGERCHGSLSFYSATPDQGPWHTRGPRACGFQNFFAFIHRQTPWADRPCWS